MNNIINAQICTLTSFPQFTKETVLGAFSEFGASVYNSSQYMIFPGFCDVHVHLRQPGFSYKETIKSGTQASAHGGYTTVFSMPNLKPVPDSAEHLKEQLDIIKKDAVINVLPYGAITVGQNGEELSIWRVWQRT